MKLPTLIPCSMHLDITESDGVLLVDRYTDALIQREMILTHKKMLQLRYSREVSDLETAQSWICEGYAYAYRKHYRIID